MEVAMKSPVVVTSKPMSSELSSSKATVNTILPGKTNKKGKTTLAAVTETMNKKNGCLIPSAGGAGGQISRSNGVALLATAAAAAALGSHSSRNVFSFSSGDAVCPSLINNINILSTTSNCNGSNSSPCTTSSIISNKTTSNNTTTNSNSNSNTVNSTTMAITINNNSSTSSGATSATATVSTAVSSKSQHFQIPSDILDDLASRFIINVPDVERTNLIRICFQIELAHWFYLDFFCAIEEKKLQPCGIKQFAMQLFQHIPFLREHLSTIDKILDDWKNYKLSVPTYGAILISKDLNYVLLVQSYWAKSSWGFPKGKVNENEEPVHCATREVYEETGYDITGLIVPNDYIEAVINYQYTRLYIVRNVSLKTHFSPRTRNEIKCCDWFPIDSLPINKNDAISKTNLGINANSFFMIMPFVKRLKKWVNDNRSGIETRRKFTVSSSSSSTSPIMTFNNGNGSNFCGMGHKNNNLNNIYSCKKDEKKDVALNTNNNNNNNKNNNNKRQRHKSMGDLDGIKLNLSNNNNNNHNNTNSSNSSNVKSSGGTKTSSSSLLSSSSTASTITTATATATATRATTSPSNQYASQNNTADAAASSIVVGAASMTTGGGGKRGDKQQHQQQHNSKVVVAASGGAPKRQLFHSQSQNGNSTNSSNKAFSDDFKAPVSSFDLIRKEKQQQKSAAAAKLSSSKVAATTTTNTNGNFRTCAKSSQSVPGQLANNTNEQQQQQTSCQKSKQQPMVSSVNRLVRQQSMIVMTTTSSSGYISPPPISGAGLIAVAVAAAAAPQQQQQQENNVATLTQKPRPSSVSVAIAAQKQDSQQEQQQQLQRMLSGTNLKTQHSLSANNALKKSASAGNNNMSARTTRPTTEQILKFNPNFDSWTNFSFTKNFIANVFC